MKEKLINYWGKTIKGELNKKHLLKANLTHYPPLCSVVFTRQCVFSCQHCIFPKANNRDIELNNLKRINEIIQATYDVGVRDLIHVGRILKKEHLPILKKYQNMGMTINLIDNGYAQFLIPEIKKINLNFNGGIDISIDGDKISHEIQRGKNSYKIAVKGARELKKIASHISITGTASSVNYDSIAKGLKDLKKELPFVKTFQITTTSPCRHHKKRMSLRKKEMQKLFSDMMEISKKTSQVLGIYRFEDLKGILSELIKYKKPKFKNIHVEWKINKLTVKYFPESIVTAEEFPIDANGFHFLPMGGDWHLSERPNIWQNDDNLILKNPDKSYQKIVKKYWKLRGEEILNKEINLLSSSL